MCVLQHTPTPRRCGKLSFKPLELLRGLDGCTDAHEAPWLELRNAIKKADDEDATFIEMAVTERFAHLAVAWADTNVDQLEQQCEADFDEALEKFSKANKTADDVTPLKAEDDEAGQDDGDDDED